jgi:hypothetical protein
MKNTDQSLPIGVFCLENIERTFSEYTCFGVVYSYMIRQALVAIGGKAERLRTAGIKVPIPKSFLVCQDKPLLYWSLFMLHEAGVTRIVLAGDKQKQIDLAKKVLGELPFRFDKVHFFKDEGKGFHALPYFTAHLLEESFFFECGHAVMPASHYQAMEKLKEKDNVIFSVYHSHPNNPRLPIIFEKDQVLLPKTENEQTGFALATPLLIDQGYAALLPSYSFNIKKVIRSHASRVRHFRRVHNCAEGLCGFNHKSMRLV